MKGVPLGPHRVRVLVPSNRLESDVPSTAHQAARPAFWDDLD
jgi:hypothetical protein